MSFKTILNDFRNFPGTFFTRVLGVEKIEGYQDKCLKAIADHNRVSIKACHSVGKTWMMGRVALWFFACYEDSIVITTAPTYRQVVTLLWGELRSAYKKSKYNIGGRLLTDKLVKSDKWYAMGFSPQKKAGEDKEQSGSTFQGFHSKHILVIFDEATGVSPDVYKMAEGLMTSGSVVKWVCVGNPTSRSSPFFSICNSLSWHTIGLTCFNSPNMIANGLTNIRRLKVEVKRLKALKKEDRLKQLNHRYKKPAPHLLSAEWVLDRAIEWGIDHPLFESKALGKFPKTDDNVLIDFSLVSDAQAKINERGDVRYIGIDVARFGTDLTVFTEICGYKQTRVMSLAKNDTNEVTGKFLEFFNQENSDLETIIVIDETGVGGGVVDNINDLVREGRLDAQVVGIHFGAACSSADKLQEIEDKKNYVNVKAKMFSALRDDLRDGLSLLNEDIYLVELPTIKYKFVNSGKVQIESKDDYKKRTGRSSPDYSDSLALANYGRHVNMGVGSFGSTGKTAPLVRRKETSINTFERISKRNKHTKY